MENTAYEKEGLLDPLACQILNAPPDYESGNLEIPHPYASDFSTKEEHARPGRGPFSEFPHYKEYSLVYEEESKMLIDATNNQGAATEANEPDYMCYSIFSITCCFLPLGIVALIYSLRTQDFNVRGDVVGARQSSRTARTMNHLALGTGFIIVIICAVVISFTVMMQLKTHTLQEVYHSGRYAL